MTAPSIALIHTQYGPYHLARLRSLQSVYSGSVHAIQLARYDNQRDWIVHDVSDILNLANGTLEQQPSKVLSRQLVDLLNKLNPSVIVIAGYRYAPMRAAFRWARQQNQKTVLLSDSQWCDRPRHPIKEWLKSQWIKKHCDAAFVSGARAADYAQQWGLPSNRIWRGYDVVDNNHFTHYSSPHSQSILDAPHFLYVGRLSPEKNLTALFQAYHHYRTQPGATLWPLVIVGSGSDAARLQADANRFNISPFIHWAGFQQIEDLPTYYAQASTLILPSLSEPWGLVVNEAMAAGLPVLVSDRCGCVPDLVFPGVNGYVFDPTQPTQLAEAMLRLTRLSDGQRQQMGAASRQIIAHYTPQTWAIALSDCIQTICQDCSS
jgi:1,2-diacylglycerol 3-alpha-glucosyltransferase